MGVRFAMFSRRLLLMAAWGGMMLWWVGRLISDRFFWSQFLSWMPAWVMLALAAPVMLLAGVLGRSVRTAPGITSHKHLSRYSTSLRPRYGLCLWLLIAIWTLFVDWRLHRAIAPTPARPNPGLRIVAFNAADAKLTNFPGLVSRLQPDVLALSNPPMFSPLVDVRQSLATATSAALQGRFALISKYPIIRWTQLRLSVRGSPGRVFRWTGGGKFYYDTGEAMLAEIDTRPITGSTTVLWIVDLPSHYGIHRTRMAGEVLESINQHKGPVYIRAADGKDIITTDRADFERLLAPEMIMGDFNTTRGSHSLRVLTGPGFANAFDHAGYGLQNSYSRTMPMLAIDHIFVRESAWRATFYKTIDTGEGRHRGQLADLAPRR